MKRPEGFEPPAEPTPEPSPSTRRGRSASPGRPLRRRGSARPGDATAETGEAGAEPRPTPGPSRPSTLADDPRRPSLPPRGDDAPTGPVPVVSGRDDAGPRAGAAAAAVRAGLGRAASGAAGLADRVRGDVASRPSGASTTPASDGGEEPPRIGPADTSAEAARERAASARRVARRATRQRRRVEKSEVRRFTRRTRHRRATWTAVGVVVVVLVGSVTVAVFSPLLSLQEIEVEGTSRVDATAVRAAVDDQLGTPLALVDFGRITSELEQFPLIASYVTETAPPHTLVIRVTERQPIATVASGDRFDLVDPAGIVVQELDARQDGVPLVDVGGTALDGTAYRSTAEVLLALPVNLRASVDTVTASTADDVALVLTSGEHVVWGSAEQSEKKAQVLAGLIADQAKRDPSASVEYDVSAPDNGIIRVR